MSGLLQNFCKDEQMYLLERRLFSKYDDNIIIIDLLAIILQVDRFSLAFWLVRPKIYRKKCTVLRWFVFARKRVCGNQVMENFQNMKPKKQISKTKIGCSMNIGIRGPVEICYTAVRDLVNQLPSKF